MNFDLCQKLTTADWIQIIIAIITFIGILTSTIIAIKTLKQNNKIIEESSKANIVFYIDFNPSRDLYYLVIKNFGNSVGKLINLEVTPKLDWNKTEFKQDLTVLTDSKNILLAPNQSISSWFEFNKYPDSIFNVKITYKSLGKIYKEEYTIDLSYTHNTDWLTQYSIDDHTDDYKNVLYKINNSLLEISDKLK